MFRNRRPWRKGEQHGTFWCAGVNLMRRKVSQAERTNPFQVKREACAASTFHKLCPLPHFASVDPKICSDKRLRAIKLAQRTTAASTSDFAVVQSCSKQYKCIEQVQLACIRKAGANPHLLKVVPGRVHLVPAHSEQRLETAIANQRQLGIPSWITLAGLSAAPNKESWKPQHSSRDHTLPAAHFRAVRAVA